MQPCLVLLCGLLLLSSCAVSPPASQNDTNQASNSTLYKESFFKGEIPITWSYVFLGDIGPMPYHEAGWIEPDYIQYSFAKDAVSYGDTNWTQVDIAFMEGDNLRGWVTYLKADPNFNYYLREWKQEIIDGRTVDVAIFSTEPDETVSKGGTGGKIYFVPAKSDKEIKGEWFAQYGVVIHKQALGDEEFEMGFQHFMDTVDFDFDAF